MACIKKGCNLDGYDDRMVICWLCHGLCHFKCCGLSGLVGEAIAKNRNLHWRCNACQKFSAEFYRFFQSTKNNFSQIQNNLNHLTEQINAYGKLFDDFKSLDGFQSPSPTRRKSPRFLDKENSKDNSSSVALSTNSNMKIPSSNENGVIIDGAMQSSSFDTVISIPKTLINVPINDPVLLSKQSNNLMTEKSNLLNTLTDPANSGRLINFDASSPVPPSSTSSIINHHNILTSIVPSTSSSNSTIMNHQNISTISQQRELRTITPKKTIFATRFALDTKAEEMKFYILSKISNCCQDEIRVFKINSKNRASFKIIVPENLFQQIVNPEFWPKNALIREFIYNEENNARLPNIAGVNSKN